MKVGDEKDIFESDIFDELITYRNIVDESVTPMLILCTYTKKCNRDCSNLCVVIRIMLTILITLVGAKKTLTIKIILF